MTDIPEIPNKPRVDMVTITMERVGPCEFCGKRMSAVKSFKAPTLELATDAGYAWQAPLSHKKCRP